MHGQKNIKKAPNLFMFTVFDLTKLKLNHTVVTPYNDGIM